MTRIVVLDGYTENPGDLSWSGLEALGTLTVHDRTPDDQIVARIGDAEAVFTNKTPLSRATLDACPTVRFVGVLATGYNVVDYEYARARGVTVTNIPTYGTAAVAQFAIALLLEVCHHVGHHATEVAKGRWSSNPDWCFWDFPLVELAGKTLGVIGFGRIGQSVGSIARALGMTVIAHDEYRSDAGEAIATYVGLDDLYARSDVISLHVPLFPATEKMINVNSIALMKPGVIIINTSRGQLVDEHDLTASLETGRVGSYAADVASTEPIRPDNPLLTAPNCLVTPHIAWAPKESRQRLMDVAVDNLARFLAGTPVNVVD